MDPSPELSYNLSSAANRYAAVLEGRGAAIGTISERHDWLQLVAVVDGIRRLRSKALAALDQELLEV